MGNAFFRFCPPVVDEPATKSQSSLIRLSPLLALQRCGFPLKDNSPNHTPDRSSHFDSGGNAHMVDVSAKAITVRQALARGDVRMTRQAAQLVRCGDVKKGDVLGIARLAAIQATKLTPQLIPLCHAIPVESVSVEFQWPAHESTSADTQDALERETLRCLVAVRTSAKTGVEMEAMTGASLACLTVYDMLKSVDREISIGPIELLAKSGGKSGEYRRSSG
jgi:cyclic pyranopterin phosphate synthase